MTNQRKASRWPVGLFILVLTLLLTLPAQAQGGITVFINELHYDNADADTGEAVEVAGPAGTDLTGWSIALYNGSATQLNVYDTINLSGVLPDLGSGIGTLAFFQAGIQNGSPDGLALIDPGGNVIQFLSYEGSFTAASGPAAGQTSTDIGVAEGSSTPLGDSLQLTGAGSVYEDFAWSGPTPNTFGNVNTGQTFEGGGGNAVIIPACGGPLTVIEGNSGSQAISASDSDGTVTGLSILSIDPAVDGIVLANIVPADAVGGTATATLEVADSVAPGSYSVVIGFSNNDAEPQSAQCTVNVSVNPITPIYEIQGDGQFSPFQGQTVTTMGVVTLISGNGRVMWIQDPKGDRNKNTSDGIFVDDRNTLSPQPQLGDLVIISGEVEEQQFGTALPLTRIDDTVLIEIVSSGNALPKPVRLNDLPDEIITEGIDFWEPLEGMLVEVRDATVTAPTNGFGEFGLLARRDSRPGSGYFKQSDHIIVMPSHHGGFVDYNPERIMVDDSAAPAPDVQPGDKIGKLVGVVDYTFSMYKLQIASIEGLDAQPIPAAPVSKRTGPEGNLTVTSFNTENLFDLVDNPDKADQGTTPTPAALETQLAKLALAIELELGLPQILVAEEIENTEILQVLGDRVNAAAGTNYVATSFETSDARGIEVGFLWDANRVELLDAFQLTDAIVPGVSAAFGPGSASPGREPLVGKFNVTGSTQGQPLWIIGNHFKSKGGDDPLYGVNQPPIRITEVQRKLQARVVRDYVNILLDADHEAWVMVAGDLNDFAFAEPGEGDDHPVAIVAGGPGEVPLTNLIESIHEPQRYTFVFDGNSQVLDHMLLSPALLDLKVGQTILHFNNDYPASLRSDPTTPLSSSDHDPLEGRFQIKAPKAKFTLTILHNNDGESQLINAGQGLEDFGGVARFATLVDNLRAEAVEGDGKREVVLLSSGDNFLAGPELNASFEKGVPYYDSIAVRKIGYDAMAIGNHEFDFGPDVLANFIQGVDFAFPFVSANLDFSQEPNLQALVDLDEIVKSHIVKKSGELIGIVGATTPQINFISSPRNVIVDPDVAAAIQGEIDFLTANKVDKIIVISHLQNVNEDLALAGQLRGVDVMIAGGGDELLADGDDLGMLVPGDDTPFGPYPLIATGADGATIPVVTTAGDYKYVGRLVVEFDKEGRVISFDEEASRLVRVAGGDNPDAVEPDPEIQAEVVDPVQAFVDNLAQNVIATSEVALEGRRDPGVRTQETNEGNLMADSQLWQASQLAAAFGVPEPDVALQNGGGIRNNSLIPAGDITELTTFDIAPFLNFIVVVPEVPRSQFKEIMENAVSRVEFADGRFAQIAGFTMVYDAAEQAQVLDGDGNVTTPGSRVRSIILDDGTVIVADGAVVDGPALNVATIDFLANGGDQYPFRGAPFVRLGVTYQQALANYLEVGLNGLISAADYPEGGEGRIVRLN